MYRNVMDALTLMHTQARTLYQVNEQAKLCLVPDLTAAEHEWEPAPRFFMGLTAQGNAWYFRHDLPDALTAELDALCRTEPPLQAGQEPSIAAQVRDLLGRGEDWRGPAYLLPPQQETGQAVEITPDSADLLLPDFPGTAQRVRTGQNGPFTAVIENGRGVAVCSSVRQSGSFNQHGAAEAGVFTLEGSRGKGYAAQVTALWANLVREQSLLPLYSTSWENTASQAVARNLNGQFFGEDWSIR